MKINSLSLVGVKRPVYHIWGLFLPIRFFLCREALSGKK